MHIPVSDADFYERKANRLQKDIANLNQQLNVARARLRSAQDFQIKYELLLRQSQNENLRIRKIEEAERAHIAQVVAQEIEKTNQQWVARVSQLEQDVRADEKDQRDKLEQQIEDLQKKIREMSCKSQQMDVLLFKNKKIARDLEALEEIIEQNRINNERQREEDIRKCKESLTKKFSDKMALEKEEYERNILQMKEKCEKMEDELMKAEINAKQKPQITGSSTQNSTPTTLIDNTVRQQLEKLKNLLSEKDNLIAQIQTSRLEQEQNHQREIRQLKDYHKELQQKIFTIQTSHETEILNFKLRMNEARAEELKQKQQELEIIQKNNKRDMHLLTEKVSKEKAEIERIRKVDEAQMNKLKEDKNKLIAKIQNLKQRLRQFETSEEMGETQQMLQSLKNLDRKEDEASGYEEGVTFLERQLRKTIIKLEKKNSQVNQLVAKMNQMNEQFEKELEEVRAKSFEDARIKDEKIDELEQDLKLANQLIRKKQKQNRDKQAEFNKKINQINAQNRSLVNMNNDLQRDYNRILESKKVIQKSYRDERERSMTSKSEIAITKKNKWLELERHQRQLEIMYKEKEQQLKTNYEIHITDLKTENDRLRRDKELIEHQLGVLKEKVKHNQPINDDKENNYSEFHKKLATVNLEIALTENLYQSLLKAKSRVRKSADISEPIPDTGKLQKESELSQPQQRDGWGEKDKEKETQFRENLKKVEERSYKSFERSMKQIDKLSENSSKELASGNPLDLDWEQEGGVSPTFNINMFQSFNPHS